MGQSKPESSGEDVPCRAEAGRLHDHAPQAILGERVLERRPPAGAAGQQEGHLVRTQAAYDVRQRLVRRPVQPLHVVDRHEQRATAASTRSAVRRPSEIA